MNKNSNRMSLTLTAESIEALNKHTSARKRGEFISNLIMGYEHDEIATDSIDMETIKIQLVGMSSMLKSFESRLMTIENTVAVMIADSQE